MSDNNGKRDQPPPQDEHPIPKNKKPEREPEWLESRLGSRLVSRAALVERIIAQFLQEFAVDDAHLSAAKTKTDRLKLVRETALYVIAVESVQLSLEEQADVIRRAYAEIFGYGPLDTLFEDETITTIALEGADKVSIRRGHGDLEVIGALFDDMPHMRDVVSRLLRHAGAELRDDEPIIEAGLVVEGRPVRVSTVSPPVTVQLTADIRVHPKRVLTLEDLVTSSLLTEEAAQFLDALVQSPHGFVIVGDTESGKTTLLNALLQRLPDAKDLIAVERARELRLPTGAKSLVTHWPRGEESGMTWGQQIGVALGKNPSCIAIDEVRADEPEAIAPLLTRADAPRQIWAFRGPSVTKRLRSALTMIAQRAVPTEAGVVRALYERLPFVINMKRAQGRLELRGIAEWQISPDGDYADYVMLFEKGWETLERTGKRPLRSLNLPSDFWQ